MPVNRNYSNSLMDYYGSLLTTHQMNVLSDYFRDDLSMIEIAENYSISKSAVSDLIKRSLQQLEDYEKKLHLIRNDEKIIHILDEMKESEDDKVVEYANRILKEMDI